MASKNITIINGTSVLKISDIDHDNEILIEILETNIVKSKIWISVFDLKTLKDHIDYLYNKSK